MTRPIVRYHGGKWRIAPWIISHFPAHRVYCEPFGGGGSVLLRKPRAYAEVYNDLSSEMVNLFRVARDHGRELREILSLTPFARDEFNESYTHTEDKLEQARRTVVRSFMGFGSNGMNQTTGFRNNSTRSGTTPAHDWANYPAALDAVIERLQGVVVENRDALLVMASVDTPDTLHYVDPPYPKHTRTDDADDYGFEYTDEDHERLVDFLLTLKGMVILSGYATPIYDRLGWRTSERVAMADGARERTEVLWLSPNVPAPQASLFDTTEVAG